MGNTDTVVFCEKLITRQLFSPFQSYLLGCSNEEAVNPAHKWLHVAYWWKRSSPVGFWETHAAGTLLDTEQLRAKH